MNEKKEFLTEENYAKGKKKIMRLALIIFIVGFLLGGSLIATGIIKTNKVKKQNEQVAQQVTQNNQTRSAADIQADMDKIQAQIDQIDSDIKNLQNENSKLRNEKLNIFQEDSGFSERYYAKEEEITVNENEIATKQSEKSKLQSTLFDYKKELLEVKSGNNDVKKEIEKGKNTISTSKYVPFYMIGGFIILASCMISLAIYLFGKRREITAFTAQQVMPVAQEGIEKMAPTIGNAAGVIAQGVTKGIKEGIKDSDNSNK